jgi:hypothetical protein
MTEVTIGTAIIAYIEPHPGQAQAFNRWYERDHMYAATTAGPGAFSGARWVAPRACKAVRPRGADWFGDPVRGSFLTTVWLLDGCQPEWDAWVGRQMESLRADADRMFAGRDHLYTAVYRFQAEARVDGGPGAATALDRPFDGVIAMAVPRAEGQECAERLVGPELPVTAVFAPERVVMAEVEPPPFDLVLGFTDGDPLDAWRARAEPLLASLPVVGFASPFLRTIPGTDTYIDDL